jgi:predicted amidohydrolase YtcJ
VKVGKLADLVVLAEDVSRVRTDRLRHVGVAVTVLGGDVVYSAR